MTKRPLALAAVLATAFAAPAQAAQPIAGRWLTQDGSAIVQIAPCGGAWCGRIATVLKSTPGASTADVNNPDPARRNQPILGLTILSGFAASGDEWRGRIYDPRNGKTYKSIVTRAGDGTLKVKGCIAFLCQTQSWKPAR